MSCYERVAGTSMVLRALWRRAVEAKTSQKEIMLCEEISFCINGESTTLAAGDVLKSSSFVLNKLRRKGTRILIWD